jgi:hypothetical protein
MARNKAVVHRRGKDGVRIREPAAGAAVASSLHVTARRARGDRAPAPQLHVHNLVIGVIRTDGRLVAADSWDWFRHDAALEGGALFRAQVADALVLAGWAVRSGTGDRRRYFEVQGVPESLCEVMSPRSREVAQARAKVEKELGVRLQGGALAVLAKETRQAKDHDLNPAPLRDVWDALGQEHDFGPGSGSRLRRHEPRADNREARAVEARSVVLAQLREQGPTVSLARARALVFEAAAGRLSADHAAALLAQMECSNGGELLTLAGGRVTSREIRRLEQHVLDVAVTAAGREDPASSVGAPEREAGLAAAETALGPGKHLDREQRDAFELLTSGRSWVCLTGRAGTGKGPTLHAAAEAYRAAGWRVLACAMDGTTARRMAEQLGGSTPALTVEQLKVRLQADALAVDERTVIFVDEASKLDTGHWAELAACVERRGAAVRAVGHDGQHDAIRLPGLFTEMLRDPRIPTAELREIRRHRNPENPAQVHRWLRDYQIAVDEGRGIDAVAILHEHQALQLYDTRAQAMGGMVEEWDEWRREYAAAETALIVHGPNSDVDLVNELAQHKRLKAGELGEQVIRAVDRDYVLRPGDVVAIRNAAYVFPGRPGQPRPKRVENGQVGIVESVDRGRDTLTLLLREPGTEPRLVEIDQARLRTEHAAGKRTAAVRLNYALHSFPAQGATLHATATLAGHWSQAKQESYVGDTRAIYRHTVHVAREDLGTEGTDDERILRFARRVAENRQRRASIDSALDPTRRLVVQLPGREPIPGLATSAPPTTQPLSIADLVIDTRRPTRELSNPRNGLVGTLSRRPDERIARERRERDAQRLAALTNQGRPGASQQQPGEPLARLPSDRHRPTQPERTPTKPSGPTIRR